MSTSTKKTNREKSKTEKSQGSKQRTFQSQRMKQKCNEPSQSLKQEIQMTKQLLNQAYTVNYVERKNKGPR